MGDKQPYSTKSFIDYSCSMGRSVSTSGFVTSDSLQDYYKQTHIHKDLIPYKVVRECVDYEEHPETIPVIICLDLTGSMGSACMRTAQALNTILVSLFEKYRDIEFLMMGVGDLEYDKAPVQVSQFEVDVKIAKHLDNLYMEHGGGGNAYESYSAAWYFGVRHTSLDCWKRGKKGIIITMGDEPLNPILYKQDLEKIFGDNIQSSIDTNELYKEVINKFDIYHIAIDDADDSYWYYKSKIERTFRPLLGERLKVATIQQLPMTIVNCINDSINSDNNAHIEEENKETETSSEYITW